MNPPAKTTSAPEHGKAAPAAPGSLSAQWARVLTTPRGTRRARLALSVALTLLVALASVAAWQGFLHSAVAVRLSTMNEVVFVGIKGASASDANDSSSAAPGNASGALLPQLFVARPDGSGLRQLTHLSSGFYFSPVWSPDGTRIAAYRVANNSDAYAHLVVLHADGSQAQVIAPAALSLNNFDLASAATPWPYNALIAWSPDGSQLVAQVGVGQYLLVNADGTHPRALNALFPVWSPDGRYLAYYVDARGAQDVHQPSGEYTIALLDTQTFQTRVLSGLPALNAEALAWSPDGRYLAVTAAWGGSFQFQQPTDSILLVPPNGGAFKVVDEWEDAQVEQVTWSPDSQKMAVVLQAFSAQQNGAQPDSGSDVVVIHADGSHVHQVGVSDGGQPSWSPDGNHLIYTSPDDTALLVVDTSVQPTPLARRITDSLGLLFAPCWSPLAGV